MPVLALAEQIGRLDLLAEHVATHDAGQGHGSQPDGDGNDPASMVAGMDSIEDTARLR